ncbi:hypothetical protein Taro_027574 [Colocasia esculenta]|uniref:Uncharacterized protein n=1 Tax=Colocasia esculenta TaxID=4460 RepID=A0A843VE96_COLES|nr:hypothetical protein [Colocasia esculenta]
MALAVWGKWKTPEGAGPGWAGVLDALAEELVAAGSGLLGALVRAAVVEGRPGAMELCKSGAVHIRRTWARRAEPAEVALWPVYRGDPSSTMRCEAARVEQAAEARAIRACADLVRADLVRGKAGRGARLEVEGEEPIKGPKVQGPGASPVQTFLENFLAFFFLFGCKAVEKSSGVQAFGILFLPFTVRIIVDVSFRPRLRMPTGVTFSDGGSRTFRSLVGDGECAG